MAKAMSNLVLRPPSRLVPDAKNRHRPRGIRRLLRQWPVGAVRINSDVVVDKGRGEIANLEELAADGAADAIEFEPVAEARADEKGADNITTTDAIAVSSMADIQKPSANPEIFRPNRGLWVSASSSGTPVLKPVN